MLTISNNRRIPYLNKQLLVSHNLNRNSLLYLNLQRFSQFSLNHCQKYCQQSCPLRK